MKTRHIMYAGLTVLLLAAMITGSIQYQANAQCPPATPMSSPMMATPLSTPMVRTTAMPLTDQQRMDRINYDRNQLNVDFQGRPTPDLQMLQNPQTTNRNILDTLNNMGQYSSFLSAMRNAGLENRLQTGMNLSVFVPTNQAFDMLPPIPWRNLQMTQNRNRLNRIMSYHIVQGPVTFSGADLSNRLRFKTMEGDDVIIRQSQGMYFVENSQILAAYRGTNGTIYVVDTVLIPGRGRVEFLSTEKVKSPTDVEIKQQQQQQMPK